MSLIWSLKKLFDPLTHAQEEGEKQSEREEPERNEAGAPPRFTMAAREPVPDRTPARFRCRVCDHTSADGSYCPTCLADTMQAVE